MAPAQPGPARVSGPCIIEIPAFVPCSLSSTSLETFVADTEMEEREDICPVLFSMARATTPEGPRFPCSPKQALTLYQILFQRPAGLGLLQRTFQQAHEGWDCPPGLELPMMLLEMDQSLRAQEKILWNLELLTGVGLGLFWPPWARFCGQRDQTQPAWSQYNQSWGRNVAGDSEQRSFKLHLPPQAEEAPSERHQLLRGRQAADPSSASDPGGARSDAGRRLEGPIMPAELAPTGVCQEAKGAGCSHPTSQGAEFKESGNSELEDPGKVEEKGQEEPNVPSSCGQTLRSPQEGRLGQVAPEPSHLPSQDLPALQDSSKGRGASLSHESAEPQTLMTVSLQGHPETSPQSLRGQSPRGYKGESIRGHDKGVPQSQGERKPAQQGQEFKSPQSGEDSNSEVWGEAQEEGTVLRPEEGEPQGHSRDFRRSPGKPIPQCVETGVPGPQGNTQATLAWTTQEGTGALPPASVPPSPPSLRDPGGGMLAFGTQEPQPRLPGVPWEQRGSRDPKFSKAVRPEPGRREETVACTEQEALQRLLELHCAAKERRRRDREQQRLRVLERLRILGNHHRRVHPLGLPPKAVQMAQMARQVDAAEWRHVLRERLEQVHRGRTQWLRALGARNTQNFQELLSPGNEEPGPGE